MHNVTDTQIIGYLNSEILTNKELIVIREVIGSDDEIQKLID